MKKFRVHSIVILVAIALLALLVIQGFQTLQLYDRKHTEFETTLGTSLERIAIRHEKAEDLRRYLQIINHDFSGQYKDVLKQEFQHLVSSQESISINDTTIFKNGEFQKYLIIKGKAYDSISGLTAEQKVLARDVRQLRDLFDHQNKQIPHNDSIRLAVQLDQRVLQQIFKKAKFVNDMMVEAFRNNVYQEPEKRIDIAFLDSVIRTEIANDNLPKTYRFMVANSAGIPIRFLKAPVTYANDLDTLLTGKTTLFPSNILDESLQLHIYFPKMGRFLLKEMWGPLTISLSLMLLIVVALFIMFKTIVAQEKLAEMKNDFISNMTHEFKTPISTISLACEAMNDQDVVKANTSSIGPFVKIIKDENARLEKLAEQILQSATVDRGQLDLKNEKVNAIEVIREVVQNASFRLKNLNGKITLNIPEEDVHIYCDRMHFSNIIYNLVDNAIKYSPESPQIILQVKKENKKCIICVKDRGIGIKREHLNKIFDKLYRVPTGNVHNVKGFGLGLSYVKAIANIYHWKINVQSKYKEGSEFTLEINDAL